MAYSPEQRANAIAKITAGLSQGTPLTILCGQDDMPSDDTVRNWMDEDENVARDIARARARGHDAIAQEVIRIADETSNDTITSEKFGDMPNKEWIERSKLRCHVRMQLLAKWDPKRYGDMIKHAGADGGDLKITVSSEDAAL